MYLLSLFLPFLASIFCGLSGNFLGSRGAIFLCCFLMFLSFVFSLFIFFEVILSGSTCVITLGSWISVGDLNLNWSFLFDSVCSLMFLVVTFISLMVHLFSADYMSEDPHKVRFFSYLSLFTFFMLFLVCSNNFVQMFVGWEGVGLCSYLLVNFWYTRTQANKSSLKAIIVNRFGDFGIYMALMSMFYSCSSLDYGVVFSIIPFIFNHDIYFLGFFFKSIDFIGFFIFIGVIGKSAQLGLHTWLPDAMEGPTPVSALIHAATMVTAGIFLVIRSNIIFEYSPKMLFILCIWGSFTALFASSVGIFQNDLKKVIAYSTCSQLGYMLFCCGLSYYSLSFFHLFNHAFFKALLFLSAGSVIHAMFDEQDMRKFGGLVGYLPFTYVMFFIASLSLMGLPFLTGFYSKDFILEFSYGTFSFSGIFAYWLGVISAFFTSIYSFRLLYLTFYSSPNFSRTLLFYIKDASKVVIFCFCLLCFFSIFIGYFMKEIFISFGVLTWETSIFYSSFCFSKMLPEMLPTYIKMLPILLSILGSILILILFYFFGSTLENIYFFFKLIYNFLLKKWFIDDIYNKYFVDFFFFFSYFINLKSLDRGLLEYLGPFGFSSVISSFSFFFSKFIGGFLFQAIISIFVFVCFVFLLLFTNSFKLSEEFFILFLCLFFIFVLHFSKR